MLVRALLCSLLVFIVSGCATTAYNSHYVISQEEEGDCLKDEVIY